MHSDPIADMLTRIRNACRARKSRVDVPTSKLKLGVADILKREGYIQDYRSIAAPNAGQGVIEIKLKYDSDRESVITDLQRVSKPGLRKYLRKDAIPKIRHGQGTVILTTSKGLMTDREARRDGVGGEPVCAVW
jgi:small subunit ribosomal protein S8